jgi:hypothetical protein
MYNIYSGLHESTKELTFVATTSAMNFTLLECITSRKKVLLIGVWFRFTIQDGIATTLRNARAHWYAFLCRMKNSLPLLRYQKVQYCVLRIPSLETIQSQSNSVHILSPSFFKDHLNPKFAHYLKISYYNIVCISCRSHASWISTHLILLDLFILVLFHQTLSEVIL